MKRLISFHIIIIIFLPHIFGQSVIINEVLTSPNAGPSGSTVNANSLYNLNEWPSENREWIELYNPNPCNSVDISCYTLASNMQPDPFSGNDPNWGAFTFPQGTVIPPLGFIIIGGNQSQVPVLDFNITNFRQSSFGVSTLDGDQYRWFLRDAYGWIALYDPNGNPVDAVFWNIYDSPALLSAQEEYLHPVVTTTTCSGTQNLASASQIPGIEFAGAPQPGSYVSFQRLVDGSLDWGSGPRTPTPRDCNGPCVVPPEIQYQSVNPSCGLQNGSITFTIDDGGTGPYGIEILPAGLSVNNLSDLSAGTYTIIVTDAYNCFGDTVEITLVDEAGPLVNLVSSKDETCSSSNGEITMEAIGGTPPYVYAWNTQPQQTSFQATGLSAGTYQITVTDSRGCSAVRTASISNYPKPEIAISNIVADTCGRGTGGVELEILSGIPPYNWTIPGYSVQNMSANGFFAGDYIIEISDSLCTNSLSFNIPMLEGPRASFEADPEYVYIEDGICNFLNTSTGGATSWLWNFGDGGTDIAENPSHKYLSLGTYDVWLWVENDFACRDSVMKEIVVKDLTAFFVPNAFTPNGDGQNDFFLTYGHFVYDFQMDVFDRWGKHLFHSDDIQKGWNGMKDGVKLPSGVYVYSIKYSQDIGLNVILDRTRYGKVTLVR